MFEPTVKTHKIFKMTKMVKTGNIQFCTAKKLTDFRGTIKATH